MYFSKSSASNIGFLLNTSLWATELLLYWYESIHVNHCRRQPHCFQDSVRKRCRSRRYVNLLCLAHPHPPIYVGNRYCVGAYYAVTATNCYSIAWRESNNMWKSSKSSLQQNQANLLPIGRLLGTYLWKDYRHDTV